MRKILFFTILSLLIINTFFLISAENDTDSFNLDKLKTELDEINTDDLKTEFGAIQGDLNAKTENVLTREVKMKEPLNGIVRFVLGIREDNYLTIERLVISIVALMLLFIFSFEIIEFTPFETKWVKITISTAITVMAMTTGIVYSFVSWIYKIVNNIWIIIGIIAAIFAVLFLAKKLLNMRRKQDKILKAKETGMKVGTAINGLEKTGSAIEKELNK